MSYWQTGDQADALSEAYRDGGYWTLLTLTEVVNSTLAAGDPFRDGISTSVLNDDFFSEGGDFRKMYDITSGKFPGFVSHNHLSLSPRGPMKDDKYYRKACDMTKSQAVIDEECKSLVGLVRLFPPSSASLEINYHTPFPAPRATSRAPLVCHGLRRHVCPGNSFWNRQVETPRGNPA